MMKKILILLILVVLTGCNVNYDLVITDKEEIREKITIKINNQIAEMNNMEVEEYLDYYSNIYKQNDNYKDFKITTKQGKYESSFAAANEYKSLDDYIASYSFKSMFNEATIERVGKYTSVTTSTNEFLKNIKNDEIISEDMKYNTYEISIKFYNKIANHNADEVDEKNNIYTWNVTKDTTKDYIYFKIGPDVLYSVVIKDFILNNIVSVTIIGIGIVVLLITGLYVFIKVKKNNEI